MSWGRMPRSRGSWGGKDEGGGRGGWAIGGAPRVSYAAVGEGVSKREGLGGRWGGAAGLC